MQVKNLLNFFIKKKLFQATEISENGKQESATRTVSIAVEDVDDNLPQCEKREYNGEIVENALSDNPLTLLNDSNLNVTNRASGFL